MENWVSLISVLCNEHEFFISSKLDALVAVVSSNKSLRLNPSKTAADGSVVAYSSGSSLLHSNGYPQNSHVKQISNTCH